MQKLKPSLVTTNPWHSLYCITIIMFYVLMLAKTDAKEYEIWFYDKAGKLWYNGKSKNFKLNFNTQTMPSGNYFLHMRATDEKEIIKKQVIIQHN